ncbi:DNA replication and repair protein RecF [Agaricicola taiwanensis]|uniref:DNA replication and repair protein RecF n=1 Tax=Agaricicola taiwanensis TaxID=591372 RepID=A0A8J2VM35_9RHOB|nr:DNA replication/repair protein RecF [Agaricicola taiwanensis]GGE29535.1 DNA replication and repair protein RecF [Agaricicola taiwanensis]
MAIRRLRLTNFRNHAALELTPDGASLALAGPNGAGKTNILEAVSLFAPGRGLRRAAAGDIALVTGDGSWAAACELDGVHGEASLGTGIEPAGGEETGRRRCRVNGAPAPSPSVFSEHLRIVWLTPAMDGLFAGSPGDRRRFLDRLVLAADPEHGPRVAAYERALRTRNRLLEEPRWDLRWLDAAEREAAELAVAVAAARAETVARLSALIEETRDPTSPFPWARLMLEGALEAEAMIEPAAALEDRFAAQLAAMRHRDRAAGRAIDGPQASDLVVHHGPKAMPAALSSTGEQKALLLGLVLAHARLVARLSGATPLVLLDEVAAHLDPERRAALYGVLDDLGCQAWMTGADAVLFESLPAHATLFAVSAGRAARVERS